MMKLDDWQQEVLETKGNLCLRSGRQVGKSTIIGMKAAKYALENENKTIMIISKTERQAGLLFQKILLNVHEINKSAIKKGKDRPTKHIVNLKNGSTIHCLPAGETGYGIMGFTIDLLIADEAAFIPEEVWVSIIPALTITRGNIWLLSTPFVKEGYYYRAFKDPKFRSFHMSSEECPRKDQSFLDHEKSWMTNAQYAQMYLGEFRDELRQFFPDELIQKVCIGKRRPQILRGRDYFLGTDVARRDRDEFTFEIIDRTNKNELIHVENILTRNKPIPESARRIITLNTKYNFKKEYIDSGGMGITVCDILRENNQNKRKVVEINNASRVWERDSSGKEIKEKKKKLLKQELYENLKALMELGRIILLDDDEVKASLKSIQYEYPKEGRGDAEIYGSYSHITEGLIRAAWCTKDKHLNIYLY